MKIPSMIPVSRLKNSSENKPQGILPVIMGYAAKGELVIQDPPVSSRYSIRDLFRSHFKEYLSSHEVPFYKERAVRAIMSCGTGELGYTLSKCSECGTITMHADSCGNRNCPSCGYPKQLKWINDRNADLLEGVPYVHAVFTLPHDLNSLIYNNQKVLLNHLFSSVKQSVLDLCMEKYELIPGLVMVLHTFSSDMSLHYHIHMLATAAGISSDKTSFKDFSRSGYFLPVDVLSMRYRGNFLQGLKDLKQKGKLLFSGTAANLKNSYEWNELLNTCYEKDWNVEVKKYQVYHKDPDQQANALTAGNFPEYVMHPPISSESVHHPGNTEESSDGANERAPDAEIVNNYFSQYTFRIAITDNSIKTYSDEEVEFDYKQYHDGNCTRKTMKLKTDEFIRRFLLHILEPGFQRIRYAGFLASCIRKKMLSLIRELLDLTEQSDPLKDMTLAELVEHFTGINPAVCPVCSGKTSISARRIKIGVLAYRFINSCYIRDS